MYTIVCAHACGTVYVHVYHCLHVHSCMILYSCAHLFFLIYLSPCVCVISSSHTSACSAPLHTLLCAWVWALAIHTIPHPCVSVICYTPSHMSACVFPTHTTGLLCVCVWSYTHGCNCCMLCIPSVIPLPISMFSSLFFTLPLTIVCCYSLLVRPFSYDWPGGESPSPVESLAIALAMIHYMGRFHYL
jgi:hypothetical protein